jgi:hypothetical protein
MQIKWRDLQLVLTLDFNPVSRRLATGQRQTGTRFLLLRHEDAPAEHDGLVRGAADIEEAPDAEDATRVRREKGCSRRDVARKKATMAGARRGGGDDREEGWWWSWMCGMVSRVERQVFHGEMKVGVR